MKPPGLQETNTNSQVYSLGNPGNKEPKGPFGHLGMQGSLSLSVTLFPLRADVHLRDLGKELEVPETTSA